MPRIAAFGGVYANPYALRALLDDARRRGCDELYCLGDLGGFGAECDAVWPLLLEHDVTTIAGNYDVAIGRGDDDCGCGYADERDNAFAQVMYDYTRAHTSARVRGVDGRAAGRAAPARSAASTCTWSTARRWRSTTSCGSRCPTTSWRCAWRASGAQLLLCTHTGIAWSRMVDGTA